MISNTWTTTPCEKLNRTNHDFSTNSIYGTLSKVTLRSQKSKKRYKKNLLAKFTEEPGNETTEVNIFKANETVFEKHIENSEREKKVENDDSNVKEDHHIVETQNNNYYVKPKKHKKKKHKYPESDIEPQNNTVVPSSYTKEKSGRSLKLKTKSERKTEDINLRTETSSNSGNFVKNDIFKADKTDFKRHIENSETETKVDSDDLHVKEERQMVETPNNNCYVKLKKHKKIKLKYPESNIESENDTLVSSSYTKGKSGRSEKVKTKIGKNTEDVMSNQSIEEKVAVLNKIDSPVMNPNDSKHSKRKLSLSQPYLDHTVLDGSIQYNNNYTKLKKKKHKPNSKDVEHKHNICNDNNSDNFKFNEKERLRHFQKQGSVELCEQSSCSKQSYENHVSTEISSSLSTPKKNKRISVCDEHGLSDFSQAPGMKYQENETQNSQAMMTNTSYVSKKKSKKKRESSSLTGGNKFSTKLHKDNNYHNLKEPNKIEEASTKPSQKHKHSLSSGKVLKQNSTVINPLREEVTCNLPETKEIINTEVNNGFCSQELTTTKKLKMNSKQKQFISNEILDVGKIQQALIAEALNKASSKSVKINMFNEPSNEKISMTNTKPNNKLCVEKTNPRTLEKVEQIQTKVNESLCDSFSGNGNYESLTVTNNENKDIKSKQRITCLSKDESFNVDKIKQDLLSAALKGINKSPKSSKKLNKETNNKRRKKISKTIQPKESTKESNSRLQPIREISMSNQAFSQPCTSQDLGSTDEVKSDKTLNTLMLPRTHKRSSQMKTKKHKSKLSQDAKLDIRKIQQVLLEAALKKVNSEPIESKKSENAELYQPNIIVPTKGKQVKRKKNQTKCVEEVKEKNIFSKKKVKSKSILNPLEDLTAMMLSAELKKRKLLKTSNQEET